MTSFVIYPWSPGKCLHIQAEQANKWEQKFTLRHLLLTKLVGHYDGKKFAQSKMIYTSFNKGFYNAHISNIASVIIAAWISEMFQGQIKRCTTTSSLRFHLIKLSYRNSKIEAFRFPHINLIKTFYSHSEFKFSWLLVDDSGIAWHWNFIENVGAIFQSLH